MLYPMALAAELLPIITSDNLLQKYAFHVWKTFSFGVKKGFYQERQKDDFFRFFPTDDPSSRFWSIMVCGWVVDLIFFFNLTQTTYFYDFSWLDVSILRNSPSAARWRVECLPWSNKKRQKFIDFYGLTPIEVEVVWIDKGENSVSISAPHS